MLTISDAFDRLLACVIPLEPELMPLDECLGLTLAENVVSADDSPPFDKSLMDGFAVRSIDFVGSSATLDVVDVITAGQVPTRRLEQGEAIQIMTGAPIPDGADLVVRIEEAVVNASRVRMTTQTVTPGSNILRRGTSVTTGDVVLRAGMKLNGSRIGALAELGRGQVLVYRRPRVAVLATGDELVSIDVQPGPGQIRNSNQSMLAAQIQSEGATAVLLGIARDDRDDLRAKIELGIECDMLVLSGGVSAGTLDLVPSVLAAAGVNELFHKVEMKPGKPVWFGHRTIPGSSSKNAEREPPQLARLKTEDNEEGVMEVDQDNHARLEKPVKVHRTYVFGLPGNPVSSLVCCELFVRTAIRQLMGESSVLPQSVPARLEHEYSAKADRPTYHPARLTWSPQGPTVTLVPWHGSSDLCATVAANAMAFLSGEARQLHAGDTLETIAW